MTLRQGLLEQDLAYRFGVGQPSVSRILQKWLPILVIFSYIAKKRRTLKHTPNLLPWIVPKMLFNHWLLWDFHRKTIRHYYYGSNMQNSQQRKDFGWNYAVRNNIIYFQALGWMLFRCLLYRKLWPTEKFTAR